jgi:hypothetical protein
MYFSILIINIILGAPTSSPEVSAVLLTRLRRASAPAGLSESLNRVLDPLKRSYKLEDEEVQLLENMLKEGENFESSQNGGSFSPVINHENGKKISSLPE